MTANQILKDLKAKKYQPIYFLMGEEAYYIDMISNYIAENVLTESEKSFNQSILYGRDTDIHTIIAAAKRFPMMSDYQVVIVKEAQNLRSIDELAFYADKPQSKTILVFCYKYKIIDKRKKVYKLLKNKACLFESKKLYDNKLPAWIKDYVDEKKCEIEQSSSQLLADYLGNDLAKISNELDKLILTLPSDNKKINSAHIEKNIGISKDYNTFELNKALTKKDILKANRIINYFAANQKEHHISLVVASLFYFFSKLLAYHYCPNKTDNKAVASALSVSPFFVNDYREAAKKYKARKVVDIISLLREYDLKSKGVGNVSATAGDLLKDLVFRILH